MADQKDALLASVSAEFEVLEKQVMPGIAELLEVYGNANEAIEQYEAFLRQTEPAPSPLYTTDTSSLPKY